jgi:hypothetical protein
MSQGFQGIPLSQFHGATSGPPGKDVSPLKPFVTEDFGAGPWARPHGNAAVLVLTLILASLDTARDGSALNH